VTLRYVVFPSAREDIDHYAEFIAGGSYDAGLRFLKHTEATIASLVRYPGKGRPRGFPQRALSGVRSHPIKGFPNHLIFYRVEGDVVLILRVLGAAMDHSRIFGPTARKPRKRK